MSKLEKGMLHQTKLKITAHAHKVRENGGISIHKGKRKKEEELMTKSMVTRERDQDVDVDLLPEKIKVLRIHGPEEEERLEEKGREILQRGPTVLQFTIRKKKTSKDKLVATENKESKKRSSGKETWLDRMVRNIQGSGADTDCRLEKSVMECISEKKCSTKMAIRELQFLLGDDSVLDL